MLTVEAVELPRGLPTASHCMTDHFFDESQRCSVPITMRFLVTNRANPSRPALDARWTSQQPGAPAPEGTSLVSRGLGLERIGRAATACGMVAELWQEEDEVCFQLCLRTSGAPPPSAAQPFPPGRTILVLSDGLVERRGLCDDLRRRVRDARVAEYGRDAAEVEQFRRDALEGGDVVVLDETLDVPGVPACQGSAIVKELRAAGYEGFACIWSRTAAEVWPRLATRVCQVRCDQMEPGPTESDTGRRWFLLSSGCDRSRYH